ncbi:unnamed protein product [Thlaspi arvense]|uniref:non-specific serine/threonine protein kinase n=1 Tax=Thlaspi arvense TaxID=13288 RepID=A0AAU9S859_THLAR|nr:unnamed protein product [Thlaspi arvense]
MQLVCYWNLWISKLPDLPDEATDLMAMEETRDVDVPLEPEPQSPSLRPSEVLETMESQEETSNTRESPRDLGQDDGMCASYRASNILWSTGSFSDPIPDGFYSVVPDNRLKLSETIPTLVELRALCEEGQEADVILVDFEKDKWLHHLKRLIVNLAGGLDPVKVIKEIVGLVRNGEHYLSSPLLHYKSFLLLYRIATCNKDLIVEFYNLKSRTKATPSLGSSGFPLLGPIKTDSCRARAILFKVLADTVGLESKLVVGLPNDLEISESVESYKHMSVVVTLNTVEMMVDLTRSNGQLIQMSSSYAVYMAHTSTSRDVSCHSPKSSPQDLNVRAGEGSSMLGKPLLPNEEWNIDFSELEVGTCVGNGCFAQVFRGIWNGKNVAIKVFSDQDATVENIKDFSNEILIHSRLQHPNVVTFLGACTKPPHLSLVTEYVEKGNLYHLLHATDKIKKLSWKTKLNILRDICRGLMCIHEMGIVHRDIKSSNCLLSDEWTVKICDFGLSRIMEGAKMDETVPAGTPEWIAPEVIRNEPLTEKCDIFSFGVIIWELCTLSKPWQGVPKDRVIHAVANDGARLKIPEGPLGKLIADCWLEPEQRPSCEDILTYLATCEDSLC